MDREVVLGIDLGTSFSSAAAWFAGKIYLVADNRGEPCIPSVVHYVPNNSVPVVGHEAAQRRQSAPENTIGNVKRILGKPFDSPEVRTFAAGSAVSIRSAKNGSVILETCRGEQTPTEVASDIYRHLKTLAEKRFHLPVRKAVLTVPATATAQTTAATITAARQGGLEVIDTIHEPTAAAIAFGLDHHQGKRLLLIYDFGGGTFDVTIVNQQDSHLHPIATGGDSMLGGDDFDEVVAQWACGQVWTKYQVDLSKDIVRWDRILKESEKSKRALSALESAPLRVPKAFSYQSRHVDLDLSIKRTEIEPLWQDLVKRSLTSTAECMLAAKLRPTNFDTLLLVGGTTYVPLVRQSIAKMMKKAGQYPEDPQTAVACGAAIRAARALQLAA